MLKAFLTSAMLKKLVIAGLGLLGGWATAHVAGINAVELQATCATLGTIIAGTLAHALHLEDADAH